MVMVLLFTKIERSKRVGQFTDQAGEAHRKVPPKKYGGPHANMILACPSYKREGFSGPVHLFCARLLFFSASQLYDSGKQQTQAPGAEESLIADVLSA